MESVEKTREMCNVEKLFWRSPEKRLLVAMLSVTVFDLRAKNDHTRREARQYIMSDKEHVGSFIYVTNTLGLDSSRVRRKLLRIRR